MTRRRIDGREPHLVLNHRCRQLASFRRASSAGTWQHTPRTEKEAEAVETGQLQHLKWDSRKCGVADWFQLIVIHALLHVLHTYFYCILSINLLQGRILSSIFYIPTTFVNENEIYTLDFKSSLRRLSRQRLKKTSSKHISRVHNFELMFPQRGPVYHADKVHFVQYYYHYWAWSGAAPPAVLPSSHFLLQRCFVPLSCSSVSTH